MLSLPEIMLNICCCEEEKADLSAETALLVIIVNKMNASNYKFKFLFPRII